MIMFQDKLRDLSDLFYARTSSSGVKHDGIKSFQDKSRSSKNADSSRKRATCIIPKRSMCSCTRPSVRTYTRQIVIVSSRSRMISDVV